MQLRTIITPEMKAIERMLLHYHQWLECYISGGPEEVDIGGVAINIHDIPNALRTLTPIEGESIWLMCILGYSELEAAIAMGYHAHSTIRNLKTFALKKLAEVLIGEEKVKPAVGSLDSQRSKTKRERNLALSYEDKPSDIHGTMTGYTIWGCRCDPCRTANNAYSRAYRQALKL